MWLCFCVLLLCTHIHTHTLSLFRKEERHSSHHKGNTLTLWFPMSPPPRRRSSRSSAGCVVICCGDPCVCSLSLCVCVRVCSPHSQHICMDVYNVSVSCPCLFVRGVVVPAECAMRWGAHTLFVCWHACIAGLCAVLTVHTLLHTHTCTNTQTITQVGTSTHSHLCIHAHTQPETRRSTHARTYARV